MIKPLFDLVLLERPKAEKIGHLLIPKDLQKRHATLRCRVVAKGPYADESIIIGSNVLIGIHTGTWINADGRPVASESAAEFFICQDKDVLAIVDDEEHDDRRDRDLASAVERIANRIPDYI